MPDPCQGGGTGTAPTELALDGPRDPGMKVAMVETGTGDPGHAAAPRTYEKAGYVHPTISRAP